MQKSIVKEKLAKGEPVLTMKALFADPAIAEMIGLMGFDCLWICNEHVGIDPSALNSLIRACRASGIDAMIRTKPGDYRDLLHPLEMGAKGIMLPRVKNADEVRQVVRDMKFYPEGRRGVDGVNAEADFGLVPFADYLKFANANNFLLAQIEDPETIEHIDEIAEVDGVDVLFIGPGDLSVNFGVPGQLEDPRILEVEKKVVAACERTGKAAGIPGGDLDRTKRLLDMGFKFITGGSEYGFFKKGMLDYRSKVETLGFKLRPVNANGKDLY